GEIHHHGFTSMRMKRCRVRPGCGRSPVRATQEGAEADEDLRAMRRRSDGLQTHGKKCLKGGKGKQKSDQRVLDRHAATPVHLQATQEFKGLRLTTDGVQGSLPLARQCPPTAVLALKL